MGREREREKMFVAIAGKGLRNWFAFPRDTNAARRAFSSSFSSSPSSPSSPSSSSSFTTSTTSSSAVLLRDHISRILADPNEGYFPKRGAEVVGKLHEPLNFKTMVGKPGYDFKIRELYQREGTSWLTPVEIFQPYYGEAVARYLAEEEVVEGVKEEEEEEGEEGEDE